MLRTRTLSGFLAVFFVAGFCTLSRAQWVKNGVSLCGATGWQVSSAIVADDSGGAVVIWRDNRGGADYDIYGNRINASGHVMGPSSGIAVCAVAGDQADVHLIPDGTGGAIVAWRDGRSGYKVYAQRIDGSGLARWAANGVSLCGAGGSQMNLRIVSDGNGGALVAWSDSRSGNYDSYVRPVDAAGNLLLGTNGRSMCVEAGEQSPRDMTADGSGGAIIVWIDYRGTSADIYAQRFNADGDALWTTNGVAVCVEDGNQSYPSVVPSGGGGAIIVWQSTNTVTTFDAVYAQRFDAGGGVLWDPAGIIVCSSWDNASYPRAVTDGADGAIVAWYDFRSSGEPDVYVQRIDATGNTDLWGSCGVKAFSTGGESEIEMIPDGDGGAILALDAYYDEAFDCHIYAQRVDASGNVCWIPPRGTGVCTTMGAQVSPSIAGDGFGGAIISWEGTFDDDRDVYAQRVAADGLWGTPEPWIASCGDLPGDQGGWVRIGVQASSHDIAEERDYPIAGYNVWRAKTQLDPAAAAADHAANGVAPADPAAGRTALATERARLLELFADPAKLSGVTLNREQALLLGFPGGEWESVAFQYATQDTLYDIDAPTRNDSTEAGNAREIFIVTAHTTTPSVFVFSQPDTAWSVDNIAPGMTAGFSGIENVPPPALTLSWSRNDVSDLWKYDIHRSVTEMFKPHESNRIGTTEETTFFDGSWTHGDAYYYKLVAVDRHGNRGIAALLRPEDVQSGTMLQSFSAAFAGSVVEITWTLSEIDESATFRVLRATGAGAFADLPSVEIVRDGLTFSMSDRSCEPRTTYRYRVDVVDADGSRTLFETQAISTPAMALTLHQNHPNPFNPTTTIGYYLPDDTAVTLEVYDSSGRLVTRLYDEAKQARGPHSVEWHGLDASGRLVSSGVYFYRLTIGKETISKKMVLLR